MRLLGSAVQIIAENAEIQHHLRPPGPDPELHRGVPALREPDEGDFRLVKQPVNLGGVDLTPGDTVMLLNATANRDPTKFTNGTPSTSTATTPAATSHSAVVCTPVRVRPWLALKGC